jgi:thioredoxin reductase (NADPH)
VAEVRNLIIIGSGPAGLTAAIYAARATLKPLVIEGAGGTPGYANLPGGQLMTTTEVENFPGFENGIEGPELMGIIKKQAARFGTEYLTADVTKVDFSSHPFKVWTGDELHEAKTVIVATGANSIMLGVEGEQKFLSKGLSTCATCDGFFFTGQKIAVVGGGDSAMEESLFLTKFASEVHLLVRREELRASKIMQDRVKANPKITIHWNTEVAGFEGETMLSGVRVRDTKTQQETLVDYTGLFVAIGHAPNTKLFKDQLEMDHLGYLSVKRGSYSSVEGVFVAGDVHDSHYRQAVTAAGSGCMAAIDVERWLGAKEHAA